MVQYILALLAILTFGFFILKKPTIETFVLFVIYALPIIDAKILPLAYGFVKVFDVISVIALLLFFRHFLSFENRNNTMTYVILVALFWVITLLSKLNSQYPTENLYLLYQVFTIFIYSRFVFIYIKEDSDNKYKVINAFKVSFGLAVLAVFIQIVVGLNFSYYAEPGQNVINEETGLIRYPGMFLDSQYNSQFLAMGSFIFLHFKKGVSSKNKYLHYLAFGVATIALILAGGRSALGGFLLGVSILLLLANSKIKISVLLLGCIGATIFFAANPPKTGVFGRAESISEDFLFRNSIWEETFTIIKKYPMLGIGFGNYQKYISTYHQDLYLQFESGGELVYFDQPENGYLKILVEQGTLAFAVFICFMVLPILSSVKSFLFHKGKIELIFFIVSIITWLVAFTTVYSLKDYRILVALATFVSLAILASRGRLTTS